VTHGERHGANAVEEELVVQQAVAGHHDTAHVGHASCFQQPAGTERDRETKTERQTEGEGGRNGEGERGSYRVTERERERE
jgi:hypothetical protein